MDKQKAISRIKVQLSTLNHLVQSGASSTRQDHAMHTLTGYIDCLFDLSVITMQEMINLHDLVSLVAFQTHSGVKAA